MEKVLLKSLNADSNRIQILQAARQMDLPDWCIAAGFVRNLAWDFFNGYQVASPLQDIDLVYFDKKELSPDRDGELEVQLRKIIG